MLPAGEFRVSRIARGPKAAHSGFADCPTRHRARRGLPGRAHLSGCGPGPQRHHPAILASAQTNPASSRAMAVLTTLAGLPRPLRWAARLWSLRFARAAASATSAGTPAASPMAAADVGLRGRACCHAASTRRVLTWMLPVRVILPRETLSPLDDSDGTSPTKDMNDRASGRREKSPISAAMEKAVTVDIP